MLHASIFQVDSFEVPRLEGPPWARGPTRQDRDDRLVMVPKLLDKAPESFKELGRNFRQENPKLNLRLPTAYHTTQAVPTLLFRTVGGVSLLGGRPDWGECEGLRTGRRPLKVPSRRSSKRLLGISQGRSRTPLPQA
jgi:hypothetical protein